MIKLIDVTLFLCLFLGNPFTLRSSAESLHDLPWITEKGNWILSAKLYQNSDQSLIYEIREFIHSSEIVRGKISINSFDGKKVDIFYSSDFKNERIVANDDECHKNTFINDNWSEELFKTGWTKPLLNHVLMTGPSILFRLDSKKLLWTQGPEKTVRGFSVRSMNTTFGRYLDIKCYYKNSKRSLTDLSQADRIEFNGFDSSLRATPYRENFYMDIYSITKTDEELDKIVTVTPGLGCPSSLIHYLSGVSLSSPSLMKSNFHFFSTVSIDGPTKSITKNEMYVDSDISGVSLKTTSQTGTTELLYDYRLGLIYELRKDGGCSISAIGPDSPGISEYKTFYSPEILYYDKFSYDYLGKVFLDHGSTYEAHVWEAINYNYKFRGNQYDKFIITHYFVPSSDAKLFMDYVLVRTTLKNYSKTSNGGYKLIQTISIDYYDLEETRSTKTIGTQSHFHFSDCYPDSMDRKTFAIHYDCELERAQEHADKTKCIKFAEKHYSGFLGNLKYSLEKGGVSLARITDLEMIFDDQTITAFVTILKVPDIKDGLPSSFMNVAQSTITSLRRLNVQSEEECLQKMAPMHNDEPIIYCETNSEAKICGQIDSTETIKEDNVKGTYCKIYRPFMNIANYVKEIPLDKLESQLNRNKLTLQMFSDIDGTMDYKSTLVEDVTAQKGQNTLFQIAQQTKKLPEDKIILVKGIETLNDCYRACAHDDDDICETFSFCRYSDKVTCSISDLSYSNLSSESIHDSSCIIYGKNRLLDYVKIASKRFKQPPSIAIDHWRDECASLCSASDDCLSFQQCGSSCTFGGYYTDSLAKESDDCDIYIPKVSHRFRSSGKKIVSQVFHTEFNLNLEQCASLCHGWVNNDEPCLSFNFCPQSDASSSCDLTKYSVKDSTTKTTDSATCRNYELKEHSADKKQRKQQTDQSNLKVTSGGAAFGYIICFLTLGLITGFAASYTRQFINLISHRVSAPSLKQEDSTFGWSKQVDDDCEDQKSAI